VLWPQRRFCSSQLSFIPRQMPRLCRDLRLLIMTEGRNIHLEHRFPAENPDLFQTMARELVDLKPEAIIAVTTLGAVDVKKLSSTVPIVFVVVADPFGAGLVQGLAHPGGNATGLSLMAVDLSGKHLGLLKAKMTYSASERRVMVTAQDRRWHLT
jgi:ABC transporter substrate binding protein